MGQCLGSRYPLLGVENQHSLEQIDGYRFSWLAKSSCWREGRPVLTRSIGILELGRKRLSLTLGE